MRIDVEERGDVTVVTPEDRLDLLGYLDLEEALNDLLREGRKRLVLNLAKVSFVNSTSMAVIHRYSLQVKERGGVLMLSGAKGSVRGVFRIGGLDQVIGICDELDEAVGKVSSGRKDSTDKQKPGGTPPELTSTKT